jgi:hypothetical protein
MVPPSVHQLRLPVHLLRGHLLSVRSSHSYSKLNTCREGTDWPTSPGCLNWSLHQS